MNQIEDYKQEFEDKFSNRIVRMSEVIKFMKDRNINIEDAGKWSDPWRDEK
jgi:hypothetical protein